MAKRAPIPVLNAPIQTKRFELVPLSRTKAWQLRRRILSDKELRGLLELRHEDPGGWRTWRRLRRPNRRTRFYNAIIVQQSGAQIGMHAVYFEPYRTAALEVAIFDRNWWGKSVVTEVRKTLLRIVHEAADIQQFTALVHTRNHASILNYHKLGFEHVGTHFSARYDEIRDEPADFVVFSLRGEKLETMLERWQDDTS